MCVNGRCGSALRFCSAKKKKKKMGLNKTELSINIIIIQMLVLLTECTHVTYIA